MSINAGFRLAGAAVAVLMGSAVLASEANATALLTFSQNANGSTITGTNPTPSTTTITGTDVGVTISQYLGGGTPISAYLDLKLNSAGPATTLGSSIFQEYSGTLSFTSGPGDTGTNYLSATFTDTVFGITGGNTLNFQATEPPNTVSFTSSVLTSAQLADPRGISFSFADVTPPAGVSNGTLAAFTSTVAGTLSSGVSASIPEAGTLALLGLGLVGMGALRRRAV